MGDADFDDLIEVSHRGWAAFIKGDPEPAKKLYTRAEDVSNANPFGPVARGFTNVAATMDRAAGFYRDGEVLGFDSLVKYVSGDLGFFVEMERYSIKVGGRPDRTPVTFRVTSVVRRENGSWKLLHRHADPIATVQPAESVIRQ